MELNTRQSWRKVLTLAWMINHITRATLVALVIQSHSRLSETELLCKLAKTSDSTCAKQIQTCSCNSDAVLLSSSSVGKPRPITPTLFVKHIRLKYALLSVGLQHINTTMFVVVVWQNVKRFSNRLNFEHCSKTELFWLFYIRSVTQQIFL